MNIELTELGRHEAWLRLSSIVKAGDKHIQLERKLASELLKNWRESYDAVLKELFKLLPAELSTQVAEIITQRLSEALGQSFGSSQKVRDELRKYITKAYQSGKSEFTAKSDLSLPDIRAIDVLTKHNCYWLGEHYGKHIGGKIAELTQEALRDGMGRDELAKELRESLGGKVGGYKYWDVASSAALVRSRSFGCISGMVEAGIMEYEILAMGDERMCPICEEMNGRTFSVAATQKVIDRTLGIDNPDKFKEAMPWHTEPPVGVSSDKLVADGMSIPPFHGRCRCVLVMSESSEMTEQIVEPEDNDIEARVAALREEDKRYQAEYEGLEQQSREALRRGDDKKYNALLRQRKEVLEHWRKVGEALRAAKIEAAEKGIIFATGVADKLSENNIKEIINVLKSAPEDVRKLWDIYEAQMRITASDFEPACYGDGGILFNLLKDTINRGAEPAYSTFFHELGHLIDDKAIDGYYSRLPRYGLLDSLRTEVNGYVDARFAKLKADAVTEGRSPQTVKKSDAYSSISKELFALPRASSAAVSDLFSGVTLCKAQGYYWHGEDYWKFDPDNVCIEFFANVFSSSIVSPEGIELVKRYVPKSYKIFQEMIADMAK